MGFDCGKGLIIVRVRIRVQLGLRLNWKQSFIGVKIHARIQLGS